MCLGIPGQIVSIINPQQQLAMADVSGIQREVSLACVVEPEQSIDELVGSWILIHVGFAMSLIDEEEAHKTLELLAEMGELQAEQDDMLNTASAS